MHASRHMSPQTQIAVSTTTSVLFGPRSPPPYGPVPALSYLGVQVLQAVSVQALVNVLGKVPEQQQHGAEQSDISKTDGFGSLIINQSTLETHSMKSCPTP
jgi:hypothetical protein